MRELLQDLSFFEYRILPKAHLYREQLYRRPLPLESVSSGGNSLIREEKNCPFGKRTQVPGQGVWGKEPKKTLKRKEVELIRKEISA